MSHATELRSMLLELRETRPGAHVYILLDQECPVDPEHPLHPEQLRQRAVARQLVPIAPASDAADAGALLLQFYRAGENGYVDEDLLDLSLDTAQRQCASINGSYVAAWMASDFEPKALATRLDARCDVFDLVQGRRRRIPLHEPHRMALLEQEPDAAPFLQYFLEPVHLWCFMDAAASLRSLEPSKLAPSEAGRSARLSLDLARAQTRVHVARLALLGLVKAGLPVPSQPERRIDQALQRAAALGLAHDEDVVFFVLNELSLAPGWHQHPEAKRCLELTRTEGAPLAGLLAELPDDVLDDIAQQRISQ